MQVQEELNNDLLQDQFSCLPIQRKLSIGAVDDPLEHEADAMADKVMRMPETNFIQRKCAHCEEEDKEKETIQRKPLASFIQKKGSEGGTTASPSISAGINDTKGNGSSMDTSTIGFMESRFGADFSGVNIHTDSHASQMNVELSAKAFTVGNDIYFRQGEYQPGSPEGKRLLAHELTHTIQQSGMIGRKIQRFTAACRSMLNNPVPSMGRLLSGTAIHAAILADFATSVPGGLGGIGIPGASASPLRTAGLCGEDFPSIVPQIIGGRAGMGYPDLAARNLGILQVAEIKPASWGCAVDGTLQLAGYLKQGLSSDPEQVAWRAAMGIVGIIPMIPATYPGKTLTIGNYTVMIEWCAPGLLVYQVIGSNNQQKYPVPVPVPVPQTAPSKVLVKERSSWQLIKEFAEEAIRTGKTGKEAIEAFLKANPQLLNIIIAVGIAGLVATFAEDIATLGAGILDDLITVPFFARMITIAMELKEALAISGAAAAAAGAR